MSENNSILKTAAAGAATGALSGAATGSVIPGWGTAVGAVFGGLVGGITAGSAEKRRKALEEEQSANALSQQQRQATSAKLATASPSSPAYPSDSILSASPTGSSYDRWMGSTYGG